MANGGLYHCDARAVNLTPSTLGGYEEQETWSVAHFSL